MSTYPATTYADGVELTITSGNQLHEIINGTATEEVTTESGMVPSVRKAIADSMLFKQAIDWAQGSVETDPLQTRNFNGTLFWAPAATTANPIAMGASPVSDSNWSLAPVGRDTVAMNANLVSNSHFEFAGTVTSPPDAVARNYDDGDEIFSGIYAKGDITNVTFVDGVLNGFGELYVDVVKNTKMKESTSGVVSSIAGTNGEPYITGSSVADAGDYYRVTFSMNNTFSVKLEQGSVATGHEANELSVNSLSNYTNIVYKASRGKSAVENMVIGNPALTNIGETCQCENGTIFKRVRNVTNSIEDYEPVSTVNVKDFGAVGNGVTDDTVALKSAIASAASQKKRVFLPTGEYYITETLVLPAQCWLEGELHFFRSNGDASELVIDTDISALQLQDYTLGHRVENLVIRYEGSEGSSTKPAVINQTLNLDNNTTAGMGSHFENIYTRRFHTGFYVKAWSWQQRYINCWSEQHYRNGFFVQGDYTSAALLQFMHCSAITGNIANNSIGFVIETGNVILDNCRIENNAYGLRAGYSGEIAPDSTGANVTINNGYFEGNRQRDIEVKFGSSVTADYAQFLHQNNGHTTNAILFSSGSTDKKGSIIIQRMLVKSNNGNSISYLTLNEDGSHIWVNDCEILDLENEMQISPYFSGRYAPKYIGFREHDFEILGVGINFQYEIRRIHRTNLTGWVPEIDVVGIKYTVPEGERYLQWDAEDRLMYGNKDTGAWYYRDWSRRPIEYNSTPNLNGKTFSMYDRAGVQSVRFAGNPSEATITLDTSTMEDGDVFTVTDGYITSAGDSSATVKVNVDGKTFINNPMETTFFKKVGRSGGTSISTVVVWKG